MSLLDGVRVNKFSPVSIRWAAIFILFLSMWRGLGGSRSTLPVSNFDINNFTNIQGF